MCASHARICASLQNKTSRDVNTVLRHPRALSPVGHALHRTVLSLYYFDVGSRDDMILKL